MPAKTARETDGEEREAWERDPYILSAIETFNRALHADAGEGALNAWELARHVARAVRMYDQPTAADVLFGRVDG